LLDNAKLKILFYCHGAGKITYGRFTLTASVKAEKGDLVRNSNQ
jgi:hypothetical protein